MTRKVSTVSYRHAVQTLLVAVGSTLLAQHAVYSQPTIGLIERQPAAQPGYTLFSPMNYTATYLIDNDGRLVKTWQSNFRPGLMAYLTPDGHLVRSAVAPPQPRYALARGYGGRVEKFDWDGNLVWAYDLSTAVRIQHHDIAVLPNGNILIMAWEYKSGSDAIANGRRPDSMANGELWTEFIQELQPVGTNGANIVWEWHLWDHLIQDFDSTKANFGVVANHPERFDINFDTAFGDPDWVHFNGFAYHAGFDQIMISVRQTSEFWILDHNTTTAEAAGHTGGARGKGGGILYRWGNPLAYRRGVITEHVLEFQHDAQWIPAGYPGAGNITAFDNGGNGRTFSRVLEMTPAHAPNGDFPTPSSGPFLPPTPVWTFTPSLTPPYFAAIISGAQRQPNGNTLYIHGPKGELREIDPSGNSVWRYVVPVGNAGPLNQGDTPGVQGPLQANAVFKMRRYPPDYPAFVGRTLTPGAPIENFFHPRRVPDGTSATAPLILEKLNLNGSQIELHWDGVSCSNPNYNLLYGSLANVGVLQIEGAECALGGSGVHVWDPVPPGSLFMLVVGTDATGTYEGSWGTDSQGNERRGSIPSGACSVTTKVVDGVCP